jgi:hypothetical protein
MEPVSLSARDRTNSWEIVCISLDIGYLMVAFIDKQICEE